MLQILDLTFRWGGRVLFDQASATVPKGHRVALIGRNGTGKTTLLKLITGELTADGGSLSVSQGWRIGRLEQEAPAGSGTLIDTVLAFDRERTALLAAAETATDPHDIAAIQTRLADLGAHAAPARAARILNGLGFDAAAQARPVGEFSGGWRMRVALAGLLFTEPELLLLDEPTNYLDLEASLWLENYLRNYRHTLMLVSHDRSFLNAVPTSILHIDNGRLAFYTGGFDRFEAARRAERERQTSLNRQLALQRAHLQSFVDRFRAKATKARQAQSRLKMLERMPPPVPLAEDSVIRFDFPQPEELPPPLITLDEVAVGYGGPPILSRLGVRIDMDDRVALLGANGNGKSTLAKLLAGRLEPCAGRMHRSPKLRVGYFAQHQTDELDTAVTPIVQTGRVMPQASEEQVRAHLGRFGFNKDKAETKIGDLSGGEKARLLFALISRHKPHLLLLDEPTNHLDLDSRAALMQAINDFEGAVILISHDFHLIEACVDRLYLVAGGGCRNFDGDLADYRKLLADQALAGDETARERETAAANRKEQRRAAAGQRALLAPLRRKVDTAEAAVERLNREKKGIEDRLADPALYLGPGEAVARLQKELAECARKIADAEAVWIAAVEAVEQAETA